MTDTSSRDDSVTTPPARPSCGHPLAQARGRQRYCNPACRQRAYRDRHRHPDDVVHQAVRPQRASGVYQCPGCDTRYLGQQRCPDCNIFCTRIGTGGTCPHCDETVTLDELLPV